MFICTGNTCRSPMAEGIFNSLALQNGADAHAESAGLFVTETSVSESSIKVCAENGIDISGHLPTPVTEELVADADIILTMTHSHKMVFGGMDKVFTVGEYFGGEDIPDPYGGDIDEYRKTFEVLYTLIGKYHED